MSSEIAEAPGIETDDDIQDVIDEWSALSYDRKPYEVIWDEIDTNLLPNVSKLGEYNANNTERGLKRDQTIVDGTPRLALSTFQAGLQGRLMTATADWIAVQTPDEEMMDDRETRIWLSKANAAIAMLLNRSRFYPECYALFGIAGGMGTGTAYRYYDKIQRKEVFSVRNFWEMYLADNPDGECDTAFRLTLMTPKQMWQAFKDDTLDPNIVSEAQSGEEKHGLVLHRVIHAVRPNPDFDPMKLDKRNKRFASYYVDLDHESLIRRGGYSTMPYATWRIEKEVNEAYGRGPGWRALADIKGLYAYAKTDILAAQLRVNPALDIPAERRGNVKYVPGGRMYYDELNRDIKVINPQSDIKAGLEREQHKQQIIDRHFMVPFFTAMQQIGGMDRQRTAYEVRQIEQEMAILLGPYAMGFQIQFMDNIVEGLFWDAMDNNLIPPPPVQLLKSMNGKKLEVVYSGPLAQAQKNFFNSEPYRRTLADITTILSVDPTGQHQPAQILDNLDWDRVIKEMARANGLPEEAMLEDRAIQKMRAARQEQADQARQMAMLEQAGKAAPGLNQAPQAGSPGEMIAKKLPLASGQ